MGLISSVSLSGQLFATVEAAARAIDDMLLELVERRGTHAGFGAANAAAHIVAQPPDYESRWAEYGRRAS